MASPKGKQEDILKGLNPGEDEDIIELTEVVTEGEAETLIELPPELKVLDSLDFKTLLGEEPESPEPEPILPEPEPEGDVDGALASLLGPLEEEPQQPTSFPEIEPELEIEDQEPPFQLPPSPSSVDVVESMTAEQLVEQVMARFGETRLTEIIEPLIRDLVEKICRELFPGVAEEIISKEIEALKNSVE
jgi:hypothetical protein